MVVVLVVVDVVLLLYVFSPVLYVLAAILAAAAVAASGVGTSWDPLRVGFLPVAVVAVVVTTTGEVSLVVAVASVLVVAVVFIILVSSSFSAVVLKVVLPLPRGGVFPFSPSLSRFCRLLVSVLLLVVLLGVRRNSIEAAVRDGPEGWLVCPTGAAPPLGGCLLLLFKLCSAGPWSSVYVVGVVLAVLRGE